MKRAIIASFMLLAACGSDPELLDNSKLIYGDTGLPKNCRAIVASNVEMFQNLDKESSDYQTEVEGIFSSIDRNCGANGYSWGEK